MLSSDITDASRPGLVHRKASAFVLLGLVWAISLVVLASPLVTTLPLKLLFLGIPVGLSVLVALTRPLLGFRIWAIGLALLATQTGFQLDVGPIRTSALEVAILFLLLVLVFIQRQRPRVSFGYLPGPHFLILFGAFSAIMLGISFILGTPVAEAVPQFKGFLLYPSMAYLLAVGISSNRTLSWLSVTLVFWYTVVAIAGLLQFVQHIDQTGMLFRSDARYGPQNIFGVTLVSVALFLLGILPTQQLRKWQSVGYLVSVFLVVGAITSLSRTAALAFVGGAIFLLLVRRKQRGQLLVMVAMVIVVLLTWLPEPALDARLLQLNDSSSVKRSFYLLSGLQAWKARWLTGWGWGRGFWYSGAEVSTLRQVWQGLLEGGHSLVPSGSMPWYHNDYLNLAVQTGVIGLGLYLAFWRKIFVYALEHLKQNQDGPTAGYAFGSAAALFAVLLSGLFEHTLWRPDSAGMIGLWLGILIAAVKLNGAHRADPAT